jgi:hypothetical protein
MQSALSEEFPDFVLEPVAVGGQPARRFDHGVEHQQVGLAGDGVDQFDDIADPRRRERELADPRGMRVSRAGLNRVTLACPPSAGDSHATFLR